MAFVQRVGGIHVVIPVAPAAIPITITDSFSRGDSVSYLGNTDTGQTWVNSAVFGNPLGISSGNIYNSGKNTDAGAVVESGKSDGTIQMSLPLIASGTGLLFRYVNSSNFWFFIENAGISSLQLRKYVGGTPTGIAQVGVTVGNGDTIKAVLNGSEIKIYHNGTLKGTYTDTTHQTATKHGIYMYSNLDRGDSFSFTWP